MNEELTKILQHEYQNWLSQMADEEILWLPLRILVCLIVYPLRLILQLLWILVCLPVMFLITRLGTYPAMIIKCNNWKELINRDLTICDLMFRRSWLTFIGILVEYICSMKTVFRPYSYKSWITIITGHTYSILSKNMHIRIKCLIDNIVEGDNIDYGKVGLCEDDLHDLIKEMVAMSIKPKLWIKDGEVQIGYYGG